MGEAQGFVVAALRLHPAASEADSRAVRLTRNPASSESRSRPRMSHRLGLGCDRCLLFSTLLIARSRGTSPRQCCLGRRNDPRRLDPSQRLIVGAGVGVFLETKTAGMGGPAVGDLALVL